ncbi:MAG: HAD hydrolase-like protein [Armatimonadetes bacterium]|nr:HAD hydrolase-like protein [Armatimonadota bacterium]
MPLVDLAVFDIAGTTVKDRDHVNQCVRDALLAAGVDVPIAEINGTMGLPKPVAIAQLMSAHRATGCLESIHDDFVERMKAHYRTSLEVGPIDGAESAFAQLRSAGVKVALDTGFSSGITAVILERLGWDGSHIDGAISSDEVEHGRPFPDMILNHMCRFGIADPGRVAKIGDAPADMGEGTNAGCRFVIGVLGGTHSREQLAACPHTHIVESILDVPALLLADTTP